MIKYMKKILYGLISNFLYAEKGVWLIDERVSKSAQDNSFFFKYIRENYPDLPIFFIIDKASPDFNTVYKLGNVIKFNSWAHFIKLLEAKVLISTDDFRGLVKPLKCIKDAILKNTFNVFLRHGVVSNKALPYTNTKFPYFSLIVASNEHERNTLINYYGFAENKIKLSGLPRFDNLKTKKLEKYNSILIAPTWRSWLKGDKDVASSLYYKTWSALLMSKEFNETLSKHNIKIHFYPHFRVRKYFHHLHPQDSKSIFHTYSNRVPLNELIATTDLLITDYSSVMYDFFYQFKPVICYMFDSEIWESQPPARPHISFDDYLPAYLSRDIEAIIDILPGLIHDMESYYEQYKEKLLNIIKYRDGKNSEKIFNEILKRL